MNGKVCELATAIYFSVVKSFKGPINTITNPNPVSSNYYVTRM
jgi:hypothetical protein